MKFIRMIVWRLRRKVPSYIQAAGVALRRHPLLASLLAAIAAAGLLIMLLGPIALWAAPTGGLEGRDRADILNTTRQILLAAVGGLAVTTGLAFTARTYYLTRRGQLTDRYTRAITQLASDKLAERLGGIYALEHLMVESQRDHDTVIEVLAAFIRENTATAHPAEVKEPLPSSEFTPPRPATDVQAAFTVLCRRPERPERSDINLRRVDLRGVEASGARLAGVDFSGAVLQRAVLTRANLFSARLDGAHLDEAKLSWANLPWTVLVDARLTGADLYGAGLQAATLYGADLTDADLTYAHLEGAELCDHDKMRPATVDGSALASAYTNDETNMTDQQCEAMNAARRRTR